MTAVRAGKNNSQGGCSALPKYQGLLQALPGWTLAPRPRRAAGIPLPALACTPPRGRQAKRQPVGLLGPSRELKQSGAGLGQVRYTVPEP